MTGNEKNHSMDWPKSSLALTIIKIWHIDYIRILTKLLYPAPGANNYTPRLTPFLRATDVYNNVCTIIITKL